MSDFICLLFIKFGVRLKFTRQVEPLRMLAILKSERCENFSFFRAQMKLDDLKAFIDIK